MISDLASGAQPSRAGSFIHLAVIRYQRQKHKIFFCRLPLTKIRLSSLVSRYNLNTRQRHHSFVHQLALSNILPSSPFEHSLRDRSKLDAFEWCSAPMLIHTCLLLHLSHLDPNNTHFLLKVMLHIKSFLLGASLVESRAWRWTDSSVSQNIGPMPLIMDSSNRYWTHYRRRYWILCGLILTGHSSTQQQLYWRVCSRVMRHETLECSGYKKIWMQNSLSTTPIRQIAHLQGLHHWKNCYRVWNFTKRCYLCFFPL